MATPTKFTADTRTKIIERLRRGDSIRTAAARARVDHATVLRWLKEGESGGGTLKAQFRDAVLEAQAEAEGDYSDELRRHAFTEHDLKATMFWLSHRSKDFRDEREARPQQATVIQLLLPDGRPTPMSTIEQLPSEAS